MTELEVKRDERIYATNRALLMLPVATLPIAALLWGSVIGSILVVGEVTIYLLPFADDW